MDPATAKGDIRKLLALYTGRDKPFADDYAWGFCNGLEAALAVLENRPPFYLDKDNNYDKLDQEKYPEYFF